MTQRPSTYLHRTTLLREALDVMEEEHGRELTLEDVAQRIATSRRQLQRCFAEHAEAPFRDCLTQIRIRNAVRLLRNPELSVRQVATLVGYKQPAHFTKAFRRHVGVSPSEFRAGAIRPLSLAA